MPALPSRSLNLFTVQPGYQCASIARDQQIVSGRRSGAPLSGFWHGLVATEDARITNWQSHVREAYPTG